MIFLIQSQNLEKMFVSECSCEGLNIGCVFDYF